MFTDGASKAERINNDRTRNSSQSVQLPQSEEEYVQLQTAIRFMCELVNVVFYFATRFVMSRSSMANDAAAFRCKMA